MFIFFIQYILNKQIGEQFYHKQIFTIFFQRLSPLHILEKQANIFPIRKTSKYIPQTSLWISRLFIELANRNDKVCLTLDCSNTNKDGPGRFTTEADNPDNQLCYFNSVNDEEFYNEFVSKCIKSSDPENDFHFEIVEVKSKTNKNISFDATNKLQQLNKNDTKRGGGRVKTLFGSKKTSRISGLSGMFRDSAGLPTSDSTYSESVAENDGSTRKRAKPEYLLKR